MEQLLIALTGGIAIWLTQQPKYHLKKYACVLGLIGQPFWFYATFMAEQWGIFALAFLYTYSWWIGFKCNWLPFRPKRIRCWWLGCSRHPEDPGPPEFVGCTHCGDSIGYHDLMGDTRYNDFKDWANYWFFRKWWPKRCWACGQRFKCDIDIDHIPF